MSTLDGKISNNLISSPYKEKKSFFINDINLENEIILDTKAYNDIIYILTDQGLYSFKNNVLMPIKILDDATLFTIDQKQGVAFIISENRGIISINLKKNLWTGDIRFNSSYQLNLKETSSITSIIAHNGIIFIAVLNEGVYRIDYALNSLELLHRSFLKINCSMPQDLIINKKYNELCIVDYHKGIMIINLSNGESSHNRLPEADPPNKVAVIKDNYIVQCRHNLFLFNRNKKKLIVLDNREVSNLLAYYSKVYYTCKGFLYEKTISNN